MVESQRYMHLNRLVIQSGKSLLQYVGEAWPWTDLQAVEERVSIHQLVARQEQGTALLVGLLLRSGWDIDFGTYPTDYTDLHYVALDFLLGQLIDNERALVADIEETKSVCSGNPEAIALLDEILTEERSILTRLEELSASRTTGSPA